jgi:hypothetical protein
MKTILILPLAVALLAGCASSDNTRQSPQAQANCSHLSGAALLECQKSAEPASRSVDSDFKMVKPKARASGNFGGMGS